MTQGKIVDTRDTKLLTRIYNWINKNHIILVTMVILCFLISGISTLQYFGISWDEGLGDFFFGERYFFFFKTLQTKFLDFTYNPPELSGLSLPLFESPHTSSPQHFPSLSNTPNALTMHLMAYHLGWMDPVDAFHLFPVLLSALFLFVLYIFFQSRAGKLTAFMAVLFLASFPRFWGDMHFNPKDVPVTIFIGFVIMGYLAWYENPNFKKALLVGILFGSALGIKANAAFTPLICLFGIWPWSFKNKFWHTNLKHLKNYYLHYFLMGVSTIIIYFVSWPYLYENPGRILLHIQYITSQGGRTGILKWSLSPLLQVITTMPEVMLIFLLIGLYFITRRLLNKDQPVLRLWLAWLIIPILRISLPGMLNFNGIRHFLEFLPAAALIGGFGVSRLVNSLSGNSITKKIFISCAAVILLALNIYWIGIRYFPYQYIYYNSLVNGLSGAEKVFGIDEATDYWSVSYREGMNWLNDNTTGDISLYVPYCDWLVRLPRQIWLRPGIHIIDEVEAQTLLKEKQPFFVFLVNEPPYSRKIAKYSSENLKPVHEIIVDKVPILFIYKVNG